jgi:hypothetical protein
MLCLIEYGRRMDSPGAVLFATSSQMVKFLAATMLADSLAAAFSGPSDAILAQIHPPDPPSSTHDPAAAARFRMGEAGHSNVTIHD